MKIYELRERLARIKQRRADEARGEFVFLAMLTAYMVLVLSIGGLALLLL